MDPASKPFLPKGLYGIIGHPLGHTMSPALHNWAFGELYPDKVYLAWPLPPTDLAAFIRAARILPISGVSVTIPHKEGVIGLLDQVSPRARAIGAVNTLYWDKGRLCGENTDVIGFAAPLRERGAKLSSALVLGAGGAARAVLAGLKEMEIKEVFIANRSPARAATLAQDFGATAVPWDERDRCQAELLVNTTSLGMAGVDQEASPWPGAMGKNQIIYDLVYNPLRTKFVREAEAAGALAIGGLEMFLSQAREQFTLWTGGPFDLEKARAVVTTALAKR